MAEWQPNYPDWSKETKCTECRVPKPIDKLSEELQLVRCRTCKHIIIKVCEDCGEEMGLCTLWHPKYNCPPDKEWHLDKKRLCVHYEERV